MNDFNIKEHEPVGLKGWLFTAATKILYTCFSSEFEEWVSAHVKAAQQQEKEKSKTRNSERVQMALQTRPPPVREEEMMAAAQTLATTAALRRELASAQSRWDRLQLESQGISSLEAKVYALKDPVKVADELVGLISGLCKSPVLFFDYTETTGLSTLQATGGFKSENDPDSMSFRISSEVRETLFAEEKKSGAATLSEHVPLASVLMQKLGVAYFEAWVMTGFAPLGRLSGKRQILGVVVILNAGVDSALQRESIERILRSIGLVYENAIHAS